MKKNTYIVTTTNNRRFIVRDSSPEGAKAQIETEQTHLSPWTGAKVLTEEAIPVQNVELL